MATFFCLVLLISLAWLHISIQTIRVYRFLTSTFELLLFTSTAAPLHTELHSTKNSTLDNNAIITVQYISHLLTSFNPHPWYFTELIVTIPSDNNHLFPTNTTSTLWRKVKVSLSRNEPSQLFWILLSQIRHHLYHLFAFAYIPKISNVLAQSTIFTKFPFLTCL